MLPHRHSHLDITMGFYFFPRGGSAQVVRYLCRALATATSWKPTLFAGSIGSLSDTTNAHQFFGGIDCRSLDFTPAMSEWRDGRDPMVAPVPMPASFEDKAGVPDRIFFDLDDAAFERQVASWTRFFSSHSTVAPSVVHLHHLTPMHAAVASLWPDVPVITHLHGTELKMLASAEDETTGVHPRWTQEWVARMQQWAGRSDRIVVVARHDQELAEQLLPIEAGRISAVSGGVDTEVFAPRHRTARQRLALWKRCLVDEPRGWRPGQPEGSVRYDVADLAAFSDPRGAPVPVVLFAGRFMRFKRLQLLIEAHHLLRSTTQCRSVLVVAGGFPGEWEGEHPYDTVQRLGAADVFFVGWQGHDALAEIFNCSDVFAAPAVDEPFGLVYLEAMASGIPPIGTATGGPLSFVNVDADNPTGWLVPPDDVEATARALAEAVSDPTARRQRGNSAVTFIREQYSWGSSAKAIAALYDEVSDESRPLMPSQPEQSTTGVA